MRRAERVVDPHRHAGRDALAPGQGDRVAVPVAVRGQDAGLRGDVGERDARDVVGRLQVAAVQPARRGPRRAARAGGLDLVGQVADGAPDPGAGPGVVDEGAGAGARRHHGAGGVEDRDRPRRGRREAGGDADRSVREGGVERLRQRIPDAQARHGDHRGPQRVELCVHQRARTGGAAVVAVGGDHRLLDGDARREAVAAAGDGAHERRRIEVGHVEPPRQQPRGRVEELGRRRDLLEVAHQADRRRAGVEAVHVRADDGPRDAAGAALVDGAEAVDEERVADVRPAQRPRVVEVDGAHDGRRVGLAVVVGAGRVVHDGVADGRRVARLAAQRLVGAPLRPGDDGGLGHTSVGGAGRVLGAGAGGRAGVDDDHAHARRRTAGAHLDAVRPPHPEGLAGGRRAPRGLCPAAAVLVRLELLPGAERLAGEGGPHLHRGGRVPAPRQAQRTERARRDDHAGPLPPAGCRAAGDPAPTAPRGSARSSPPRRPRARRRRRTRRRAPP